MQVQKDLQSPLYQTTWRHSRVNSFFLRLTLLGLEIFFNNIDQSSFQKECLTTEMSTTSPTVKNDGGGQDQGQGQEVERGGKGDAPYLTRKKRGKSLGSKHFLWLYYRFVYKYPYFIGTASILRGTKEN